MKELNTTLMLVLIVFCDLLRNLVIIETSISKRNIIGVLNHSHQIYRNQYIATHVYIQHFIKGLNVENDAITFATQVYLKIKNELDFSKIVIFTVCQSLSQMLFTC